MLKRTLCFLAMGSAAAFMGQKLDVSTRQSTASLKMGGSSGFATTMEGKKARIETAKGLLDSSEMIFTVPGGSMTVAQTQTLRRSLPEGTTMMTLKNTIMKRVVEGTEFESCSDLLKGPNMWFFIEEDIGGTIKAFNTFSKEEKKKETHPILGGVLESTLYDGAGVAAIGELPSKKELYAKIAGAIKAVPTKVARVIKEPNSKLARAIKLATEPEGEDE